MILIYRLSKSEIVNVKIAKYALTSIFYRKKEVTNDEISTIILCATPPNTHCIPLFYFLSNTVKIDLTKVKFAVSGMTDYSYLYASLDEEDENSNLLLP
ncbi:hypothetical protein Fleli_2972 [Bernardetia litoralis DSM 6794]|uniref:Uncharacterized protein n=1 Tax=Bernardetia litoralis (strain ATCC 23117 / DSM 6794 / NBRC 15988 / NCIMB 1366 / Fx l1 / Sio-4) TaxID=880071 RepID=I4AMY1_BERLS|nr:hypothetical protein [Bernardetia litoralis]AFM05316.1 hypothetical protein Fleli_2972 [Bernardetia litoralis DSM 6794]